MLYSIKIIITTMMINNELINVPNWKGDLKKIASPDRNQLLVEPLISSYIHNNDDEWKISFA